MWSDAEQIEDVQEREQVHVAFLALIESGSFDTVLGAAPGSAEFHRDKFWFFIDAKCKTLLQDLSNGKNWSGDTKGANRVEQRQKFAMNCARPEPVCTQDRTVASDHFRWRWTASASRARKEKVMVRTSRMKVNIRVRVQIQSRTLCVGMVAEIAT